MERHTKILDLKYQCRTNRVPLLHGLTVLVPQYYDHDGRKIDISTQTEAKQRALAILHKQMSDRDKGLAPLTDTRKLTYKTFGPD